MTTKPTIMHRQNATVESVRLLDGRTFSTTSQSRKPPARPRNHMTLLTQLLLLTSVYTWNHSASRKPLCARERTRLFLRSRRYVNIVASLVVYVRLRFESCRVRKAKHPTRGVCLSDVPGRGLEPPRP